MVQSDRAGTVHADPAPTWTPESYSGASGVASVLTVTATWNAVSAPTPAAADHDTAGASVPNGDDTLTDDTDGLATGTNVATGAVADHTPASCVDTDHSCDVPAVNNPALIDADPAAEVTVCTAALRVPSAATYDHDPAPTARTCTRYAVWTPPTVELCTHDSGIADPAATCCPDVGDSNVGTAGPGNDGTTRPVHDASPDAPPTLTTPAAAEVKPHMPTVTSMPDKVKVPPRRPVAPPGAPPHHERPTKNAAPPAGTLTDDCRVDDDGTPAPAHTTTPTTTAGADSAAATSAAVNSRHHMWRPPYVHPDGPAGDRPSESISTRTARSPATVPAGHATDRPTAPCDRATYPR